MTWKVCGDEEDIDDVDIDDVDIDVVDNDDVDIDVEIDRRGICHKRHKQRWFKQNSDIIYTNLRVLSSKI